VIPVFAHLGHWYVSMPIWMGPFVLLFGWAKLSERRRRKKKPRPTTRP
jgi:hypothetical protein